MTHSTARKPGGSPPGLAILPNAKNQRYVWRHYARYMDSARNLW